MTLLATLVRAGALSPGDLAAASDAIRHAGGEPGGWAWLDQGDAATLPVAGLAQPAARAALEAALPAVDAIVRAADPPPPGLLVADMDSTIIANETIDELAELAGTGAEVAAVTERAMRGELDFARALAERVALIAGLDVAAFETVRRERVRVTPGAATLVATLRAMGADALLVTGGFTATAEPLGRELGFSAVIANRLDVHAGRLTGRVLPPIVDAATKRAVLEAAAAGRGLPRAATLALGDGANDIPMIEAAGLGVAYHAKPRTMAAADAAIRVGDLTTLLWAFGWRRAEWIGKLGSGVSS